MPHVAGSVAGSSRVTGMEGGGDGLRQAWISQPHLDPSCRQWDPREGLEGHQESHIFGGFAVRGGMADTVDFAQTRLESGAGAGHRGEVTQETDPAGGKKPKVCRWSPRVWVPTMSGPVTAALSDDLV